MAAKPQTLTLTTTWKVRELLDRLTATGLYGATAEETAEELVRVELRRRFPPEPPNIPPGSVS